MLSTFSQIFIIFNTTLLLFWALIFTSIKRSNILLCLLLWVLGSLCKYDQIHCNLVPVVHYIYVLCRYEIKDLFHCASDVCMVIFQAALLLISWFKYIIMQWLTVKKISCQYESVEWKIYKFVVSSITYSSVSTSSECLCFC